MNTALSLVASAANKQYIRVKLLHGDYVFVTKSERVVLDHFDPKAIVRSRIEIFPLIHHVDLVRVPSICFDVYPSILVEALSHGTKILTHRTVGNYDLAGTNKIFLAAYGKPLKFDLEQFGHFLSENSFTYSQASSRFLQYLGPDGR